MSADPNKLPPKAPSIAGAVLLGLGLIGLFLGVTAGLLAWGGGR